MTDRHESRIVFPSGLRLDQFLVINGRIRPVVAGGADGDAGGDAGSANGNAGAAAGATGSSAPPPPAPDLAALEAAIKAANDSGKNAAQSELLAALGFETTQAAADFVKAQRAAIDAGLSEADRAKNEAAAAKAEAAQAKADRDAVVAQAAVERALLASGADVHGDDGTLDPEKIDTLRRLVTVDDATDPAKVTAAVDAVKAKFPALFSAKPGTPTARSGVTGGKPNPTTTAGGKSAYDAGADRFKAEREKRKPFEIVPGSRAS